MSNHSITLNDVCTILAIVLWCMHASIDACIHICTGMGMTRDDLSIKVFETNSLFIIYPLLLAGLQTLTRHYKHL